MGNCCTGCAADDQQIFEQLELRRIAARAESCKRRAEMFASDPTLSGLHRDQLVDVEQRRVLRRCQLLAPQDIAEDFYAHVTLFVRDDDSYYGPSGSQADGNGMLACLSPVVQSSGCFPSNDSAETLDDGTPPSGGTHSFLSSSAQLNSTGERRCSSGRRLRFNPVLQIIAHAPES